jgi:hypothetical protein
LEEESFFKKLRNYHPILSGFTRPLHACTAPTHSPAQALATEAVTLTAQFGAEPLRLNKTVTAHWFGVCESLHLK